MPAMKNPNLVVLDNASYHNVKTEDTVCPNFSQKKAKTILHNTTFLFLLLISFGLARNTKSQPSIKPSLRVPACKTIKRLPLPEGIFGASDPSFGSHI
jgi:hypothetical protein